MPLLHLEEKEVHLKVKLVRREAKEEVLTTNGISPTANPRCPLHRLRIWFKDPLIADFQRVILSEAKDPRVVTRRPGILHCAQNEGLRM
jgi:hypothetical protein